MGKLSEAQRRVLDRMANGEQIGTTSGRHSSAFWWNHIGDRAPRLDTLFLLRRRGLIEQTESTPAGSRYRITDAGRAALKDGKGRSGTSKAMREGDGGE